MPRRFRGAHGGDSDERQDTCKREPTPPQFTPPRSCASTAPSPAPSAFTASPTTAAVSGRPRTRRLIAFDPASGEPTRTLERACDAGTAFDGTYLYQIAEARIDKIDPATGDVVASIPAPGHGADSGLAWAEGSLWVGQVPRSQDPPDRSGRPAHPAHHRVDRFVTGVTWVDGELWHGTWEGDDSDIRRIDPRSGAVLERLEMPRGIGVSGLESDGARSLLLRRRGERQGARRTTSAPGTIVITTRGADHDDVHYTK